MTEDLFDERLLPGSIEPGSRGIVFASTGRLYTDLARRAARTVRIAMPDAIIDLFTDQKTDDPVFDEIHEIFGTGHRPKIEAIRKTRFERTIVLDADVVVLADISEMFEVLDRFDMAGVLAGNRGRLMTPRDGQTPTCLNPVNTGVLAVKASPKVQAFARAWELEMNSQNALMDQPAFRRLLYQSDLDFVALGPAYNCIWLDLLDIWKFNMGAPRILHVRALHDDHPGDPEKPFDLVEVIGEQRARHVEKLLAADWMLGGDTKQTEKGAPNDIRIERLRALEGPGEKLPKSHKTDRQPIQGQAPNGPSNKGPGNQLKRLRRELNYAISQIYNAAIIALAYQGRPIRICVIGANDGKYGDPLYKLVRHKLRSCTEITLFEPQEYLIPFLEANYSFHPSHRIVPAAVGPEDTLTLHAIRPEHWKRFTPTYSSDWPSYRAPTGVTSTDRNCVLRWVKKHLPDECDPENLVTELTVPSKRLTGFLECLGKEPVVDVLQVDAEGFDDEVIYACDIDLTEPKIIRFEHSHLPEERLARLKKHLSKQYDLIESKMDVVGIRRP